MRRSLQPAVQMSIEASRDGKGVTLEFHRPVTLVQIPYEDAEQVARALLSVVEAQKVWSISRSLGKRPAPEQPR